MASTTYTYAVTDFLNDKVQTDRLTQEINSSAIVTTLESIGLDDVECRVQFQDVLSGGDETILDGLVAAHTGAPPTIVNVSTQTQQDVIDPTVAADEDAGYKVGDIWVNNATKDIFVLIDATVGAAQWKQLGLQGSNLVAYVASESADTYTGTIDWQQKVRLTFTPDITGDYLLNWSARTGLSSDRELFGIRIEQDDTTTIDELQYTVTPEEKNTPYSRASDGLVKVSLTADQEYTFDLDYKTFKADKTVYIQNARIIIRRT